MLMFMEESYLDWIDKEKSKGKIVFKEGTPKKFIEQYKRVKKNVKEAEAKGIFLK